MVSTEQKIKSLAELPSITGRTESARYQVGLVCGCFDILHIGHLRLFEFAKSHVDVLVVGLDNDAAIQQTKGGSRPIHTLHVRMEMVAALSLVDYVFPLDFACAFGAADSAVYWKEMLGTLAPDILFSCPEKDHLSGEKQAMAEQLGIEFLPYCTSHDSSTTDIADILSSEC